MKSQSGLTLVEVLVAVGLSAVVASIGAVSILHMKKMEKTIETKTDGLTEKAFAETFIAKILKNAGPSLNLINTPDDSSRPFFDYIPSGSAQLIGGALSQRTVTLKLGALTSFSILGYTGQADQVMYVDPAQAYTYVHSANDWTPPTFSYQGVNSNNLAGTFFGDNWAAGRLFLLWSPQSQFRSTAGVVDLTQAAPSLAFLGQVSSDRLDLRPSGFAFVRNSDPRDNSVVFSSPDRVFRRVPLVGGSSPILLMRQVEMHRLWLQPDPKNSGSAVLMHQTSSNPTGFLLADNIKHVRFFRPNVTRSVFGVEVCTVGGGGSCLSQ